MIEVEIKLPILRRSTTERALGTLDFVPGDLVREYDMYFTSDFHDFWAMDEALRIRRTENLTTRTSSCVLTFKGPKIDQISMTRTELETEVGDGAVGTSILEALGYRAAFPVNKLRQYYSRNEMHACVDQVEGLGSFLELEILLESPRQREEALRQMEQVLHDIGYSMEDTTTKSYLCMLQKRAGLL